MTQRWSRRRALVSVVGAHAVLALPAALVVRAARSTYSDVSFAEPFAFLISDEVRSLGLEVRRIAPGTLDYARTGLAGLSGDEQALRDLLRSRARQDAMSDSLTDIAGWLIPTTTAGLAAALSVLIEQDRSRTSYFALKK